MQKELWVKVNGYENYYVSNLGNIKNLDTKKELKKCLSSNGYYIVQLYKDKKPKCQRIHQLVFESFTKIKSNNFYVIDHIDNNKLNNNLDNLQITTNRFNSSKDKINKSGEYCIYKNGKSYLVRLRHNGIKKSLGTFKTIEEAIICRDKYFMKEERALRKYVKDLRKKYNERLGIYN